MTTTTHRSASAGAVSWIVAALIAMPFFQALPIDFDRSGALLLLLPALWSGRGELAAGLSDLLAGKWARALFAIVAIATIVAVACADQPAPAAVTAAEWVLLGAAALVAGRLARNFPGAGSRLLGGLAWSGAIASVVVWAWWIGVGRTGVPLYAHHRHLGLHTLSGAVASVALAVSSSGRARWRWLVIGIVVTGGMLWSGGRGPVLAFAIAGIGWLLVARSSRRALLILMVLQFVGGVALSACFWSSRPELGWWHAFERTAVAAENGDVSALTSTRSEGWRESLQRAALRPWVGHGPDGYRFIYPKLDGEQPHNLLLQLWIDLGFIGGSAAAIGLALVILNAWWLAKRTEVSSSEVGWTALLTAMVIEGGLDGVFYHLLAFLPAMLAVGVVALAARRSGPQPSRAGALAPAFAVVAGAILALHSAIFYLVVLADPPPNPQAPAARLLHAFPSTTYKLWRWTDAWEKSRPADALAWDRWAEAHASNAPLFHVRVAEELLARGDREGAIREFRAAEAKAHWSVRPTITKMRLEVENAPH